MATSREERMQQRMRGAGRHEVADDSFGFVLPGLEEPPAPSSTPPPPQSVPQSAPRSEPNTSAKRRRLNPEAGSPSSQPTSSTTRSSRRISAQYNEARADPYDVIREPSPELRSEPPLEPQTDPDPAPSEPPNEEEPLEESLPATIQHQGSHVSPVSPIFTGVVDEEVTESPAEAPGSGQRRSIRVTESISRSARLLRTVIDDDNGVTDEFTVSSPLARKSRISGATLGAASARSTRTGVRASVAFTNDDGEETTPIAPAESARTTRSQNRINTPSTVDALSSPPEAAGTASPRKPKLRKPKSPIRPPEPVQEVEEEVQEEEVEEVEEAEPDNNEPAEEIDVQTAARKIGRKRPRVSLPREESPELHTRATEETRPRKKSRQQRVQNSPAVQSQPKPPKAKKNKAAPRRRSDGEAIPIIVQRYTKRTHQNEGDTDADILNAEIPFANRGGVNVIDVLSQICDEVIESSLETLQEAAINAKDAQTKREFRTKLRALEAFQEELRTRLLEHTIALDTMHALKKRVRSVQKEKLTLRTEIMRIRAEREQVALKMDAVRVRHETANRESLHQLGLSSAMDDIELAIENGRSAPDLNPKAQKAAELANLELLISRVVGQASVASDGGGNLKQIKDFNALLERTAAVLERR
ncbi:uncharacterized protein GGS22DRAFT_195892 [Annulohypoxylon maeteangense]|uniref:uncharacterized protein n=1 Tax=Annulohypoxylon maeteangense TaxID=1927788 RepID=UPI00200807CD|nr:uncharacterized protein GGS22DRAFT_195892 [Annulohypoxylon maeteangense]KAI0882112.1 hypothetical protein GGS22DRAFT_195892 [Annulohypoxylon maeteangense]